MKLGDDIIGQKYGKLTVLAFAGNNASGRRLALCQCECGSDATVPLEAVRCGNTKSCGCNKRINGDKLVGQTFGRLTVIALAERGKWAVTRVRCRCACGVEADIVASRIMRGTTQSCGCLKKEIALAGGPNLRHGCSRKKTGTGVTPEHRAWMKMNERCNNPHCKNYPDYGARGIKVCERWKLFENFAADMGPRPSPQHSVDRFPNVNGHYEPGNCRWATRQDQNWNRRNTVWLEINGVKKPVGAWAREHGLVSKTVHERLRSGWPIDKLFLPPDRTKRVGQR